MVDVTVETNDVEACDYIRLRERDEQITVFLYKEMDAVDLYHIDGNGKVTRREFTKTDFFRKFFTDEKGK